MTIDDMHELLEEPKARLEAALAKVNEALASKTKAKILEAVIEAKDEAADAVDFLQEVEDD